MGKIDAALARMAGHRVYLDTNIFIYFLDRNPDYFSLVRPIIAAIESGKIIGHTGDAAIAKTLVKPYQTGNSALAVSFKEFFSMENFLSILPHDAEVFFITNDGGIQSSDVIEVIVVKNLSE